MNNYKKEIVNLIVDLKTKNDFSDFKKVEKYLDEEFEKSCIKDDKPARCHYQLGICIGIISYLYNGLKVIEKIMNE